MFYKNNKQAWSIRICKMSSSLRETTKELIVTIACETTIKVQALFSFLVLSVRSRVTAG